MCTLFYKEPIGQPDKIFELFCGWLGDHVCKFSKQSPHLKKYRENNFPDFIGVESGDYSR